MSSTPDEPMSEPQSGDAVEPGAGAAGEVPETTGSAGSTPEAEDFEAKISTDEVVVRRAPKYGRFMVLGAAVGAIVAMVLAFAIPENADLVKQNLRYDLGQVFGFLLLGCAAAGLALGALVALVLDRVFARRAKTTEVEHDSVYRAEA